MSSFKVCAVFVVIVLGFAAGKDSHDGFFQYANVAGDSEFEFGYYRGNNVHETSRFEQVNDSKFRTKVKWSDAYEGKGEHLWEYNHGTGHGYTSAEVPSSLQAPEPAYPAPTPAPTPAPAPPSHAPLRTTLPSIASDEDHVDEPVPVYVQKRQRSPTTATLPSYSKAAVPPYKPRKSISLP